MIETILLAMLLAKIKGHKLKPFFKDWPVYPVLLFAALYVIFEIMIFNGNYGPTKFTMAYKVLYILSFLPMVIKFRQTVAALIGTGLMILGNILNAIVMSANGGKMPVFPSISLYTGYYSGFMDAYHSVGNALTNLKPLTDYIDIGYTIMTPGDVLVRGFAFAILYSSIKFVNKNPVMAT